MAIAICNPLNEAASQYGKTITEETQEAAIGGDLAVVEAGKERLVEALAARVFTQAEVSEKLAELRERERELTIELVASGQANPYLTN